MEDFVASTYNNITNNEIIVVKIEEECTSISKTYLKTWKRATDPGINSGDSGPLFICWLPNWSKFFFWMFSNLKNSTVGRWKSLRIIWQGMPCISCVPSSRFFSLILSYHIYKFLELTQDSPMAISCPQQFNCFDKFSDILLLYIFIITFLYDFPFSFFLLPFQLDYIFQMLANHKIPAPYLIAKIIWPKWP